MSAHRHRELFFPGDGPLHRLAPQAKLVATVLFIFAVVFTPTEQFWAFGVDAALIVAVAMIGRVPLGFLCRRLAIELPFIAFALLLPLVGEGPTTRIAGLNLSVLGLWAAWNIIAKATLGVAATVLLAATTQVPQILLALERLRVPRVLVAIMGLMIRYGDVATDEMRRMRIARESRLDDPRWLWQVKASTQSAGTLFVRSYERGERVHLAMESRGYTGSMPARVGHASRWSWAMALVVPALAGFVAVLAWVLK